MANHHEEWWWGGGGWGGGGGNGLGCDVPVNLEQEDLLKMESEGSELGWGELIGVIIIVNVNCYIAIQFL